LPATLFGRPQFGTRIPQAHDGPESSQEFPLLAGLDKVLIRPAFRIIPSGGGFRPRPANHHHEGVCQGRITFHLTADLKPTAVVHCSLQQNQLRLPIARHAQALPAAGSRADLAPVPLQYLRITLSYGRVVRDDEYSPRSVHFPDLIIVIQ